MELIQSPELKTLSELITLKEIYEGAKCKDIKNAFVTNVFIPEDISDISIKTYNYFTGFVKNVETFNHRTDSTWKLIIYLDYQLYDTYTDKDIGKVKGELKKYSNINTKPKDNNTLYNTAIKNNYETNKVKLDQLLNLYYLYIKHIIENKDKYTHIKLISYKCDELNNYKYIGHTATFGSIMRFIPIFDNTYYDLIVTINISHAISIFFFYEIQKWIASNADIMIMDDYVFNANDNMYQKNYKIINKDLNKDLNNMPINLKKIAAGLFGIRKTNKTITDEHKSNFVIIMNHLIKSFTKNVLQTPKPKNPTELFKKNSYEDLNPFAYGIDEVIITIIILNIQHNTDTSLTLNNTRTPMNIYYLNHVHKYYDTFYINIVPNNKHNPYRYYDYEFILLLYKLLNIETFDIPNLHRYIPIKKLIEKKDIIININKNFIKLSTQDKKYGLITFTLKNILYNIYKVLCVSNIIFFRLFSSLDEYTPLIITDNDNNDDYDDTPPNNKNDENITNIKENSSFIKIVNISLGSLNEILITQIIPHYENLHLKKQDPPHQSTTNDDMPFLTFTNTNNIDKTHPPEEINIDTTKWSTTHFTNIAKLYAHLLKDNEPIYAVDNKQNTIPVPQQSGGFVQQYKHKHKLNLKNKIKSNKKLHLRNKTIKYNKKHIASQTRIQLKTSKYYKKTRSHRNHT